MQDEEKITVEIDRGFKLEISTHHNGVVLLRREFPNDTAGWQSIHLQPYHITALAREATALFSAIDLLGGTTLAADSLKDRMADCAMHATTVGQLREILARFPADTVLGEPRLVEQRGRFHEILDHIAVYIAEIGRADGLRGRVLNSPPEINAPVELSEPREVVLLGRSKLCDRCEFASRGDRESRRGRGL